MYEAMILRPVRRWYLHNLQAQIATMSDADQLAVLDQAIIGWLQTILLIIVIIQTLFAGLLSLLPPDLRMTFSFLHRIEWAAYVGMLLVGAQAARGYAYNLILTNRFYALGWRFGRMRIVRGSRVRTLALVYGLVILLMVGAVLYVRANGFIVRPPTPIP